MTDKTIRIGAEASSLAKARREVDALATALERLRKSGVSIPGAEGAAKVGDLTSSVGVAKFSKELLSATGHMNRLTETAKGFVRVMGDAKISSTLKGMGREYDTATAKLEKLARVWEKLETRSTRTGRTISAQTRESFFNQAAEAQATRVRTQGEQAQLEGSGGAVGALLLAKGAAAGGAGYMVATGVAGGAVDRYVSKREALVGAMGPVSRYYGQMLAGKGYREMYLRSLGVEDRSRRDASRLTPLSLLAHGRVGAAMGMGGTPEDTIRAGMVDYAAAFGVGALAGGSLGLLTTGGTMSIPMAIAGGVAGVGARFFSGGGVRGTMESPAAQRSLEEIRQYQRARADNEAIEALNTQVFDTYVGRAPTYGALGRGLGMGQEGVLHALTRAGQGRFGFDKTAQAMMSQMAVGARGVRYTENAQNVARYFGVENAPALTAQLGLATGFRGSFAGPQAQLEGLVQRVNRIMPDRPGEGMKVERESMVNAIVEATARVGRESYLSPHAAAIQGRIMTAGVGKDANLNVIAAAAAPNILGAMTASDQGQFGAANMIAVMETIGASRRGRGLSNATRAMLMDADWKTVSTDERLKGALMDEGYTEAEAQAELNRLSTNKAIRAAAAIKIPRKVLEEVGWKVARGEQTPTDIRKISGPMQAYMPGYKGKGIKADVDAAQMALAAVGGAGVGWEDRKLGMDLWDTERMKRERTTPMTLGEKIEGVEGAAAEANQALVADKNGVSAINDLMDKAAAATPDVVKDIEGKRGPGGSLAGTSADAVKNLDDVTAALGRLSDAASQFATQYGMGQ